MWALEMRVENEGGMKMDVNTNGGNIVGGK